MLTEYVNMENIKNANGTKESASFEIALLLYGERKSEEMSKLPTESFLYCLSSSAIPSKTSAAFGKEFVVSLIMYIL